MLCPAIAAAHLEGRGRGAAARGCRAVASAYREPASAFGLEAKVAHLLGREAAGSGDEAALRKVFFRLAQEPLIHSWWTALQRSPLRADEMLATASMLNGQAVAYRSRGMMSPAPAGDPPLFYERPGEAASWRDDIARVDALPGDPVRKAAYRFARIIAAHPFTDANGRFARAALQAGLAREGLLPGPCLGLAPVFCRRAAEIRDALWSLSATGEWDGYFDCMDEVLAFAADCAMRVNEGYNGQSIPGCTLR